jgi:eukaryotic-like serine/threonine-protein kinase
MEGAEGVTLLEPVESVVGDRASADAGSEAGAWSRPADPTSSAGVGGGSPAIGLGTVLADRYEILQSLGEGGMGAVYKARDRELDRIVALKVIRPELARHADILQRFKRELVLSRQVTHHNVIRIFDLGVVGGLKFITMEYVEGRDLKTRLAREKFPPKKAADIMCQVCRGLEAAHAVNVIHRDLKPQNIMLDQENRAVVMDFGLAHSMEERAMTQTGALMGTPDYMSPEQAKGERADARSDVFSVGIIFYEMLTGKVPFQADSLMGTLLARTQQRAKPVRDIVPEIPQPLSDIVARCLATDPRWRYQSASEILQDLELWQGGSGKITRMSRIGPRFGLVSPSVAWKWITLSVSVMVVVLTIAFFTVRSWLNAPTPSSTPKTVLVADFSNTTGDSVFDGTLESMFNIALEEASFLNAYNRGQARRTAMQLQPKAAKLDEPLARLVAMREGISVIITGSIAPHGAGYHITVRAIDAATGKLIVSRELDAASHEGVLGTVGRLAAPIRRALGDATPESAQIAAAETYTASSLFAAHLYAQGQEGLAVGNREDAIAKFAQAVQLDPNFGRAYSGLAVTYMNLKKQAEAGENFKKALALLDRMSEREKYRTLGIYYLSFVRNYSQAIETLRKDVYLFPADESAYNNLSLAYAFTGNIPEALAASKHTVEIAPNDLQDRANYAGFSMLAGNFDTAISDVERVLKTNPSFEEAYLPLALSTLARGDVKGARAVYARMEQASPSARSLARMGQADLELYLGRYREALEILQPALEADRKDNNYGEVAHKLVASAEAHLALGQKAKAVEEARKAAGAAPVESILYLAGRVLVQAGEDANARQLASKLESMLQSQTKSDAQLLEGEIALERNRLSPAVDAFQNAQKLRDTWISHFLLGRVYTEAGHFAEALTELETCRKRRGEATDLFFADMTTLRYLPPLYYWLGRAQEGMGTTEAARNNYKEFLALRAEANPVAPLVVDAKRRAAP